MEASHNASVGTIFKRAFPINITFNFTYRDSTGRYLDANTSLPIQKLESFTVPNDSKVEYWATIHALRPGQVELGIATTDVVIKNLERLHSTISVMRYEALDIFQTIIGWTYFFAWTLSFYPQVILNWRRKNVQGLSFDFLAFNILGFICYSLFNIGLYAIPYIQEEYYVAHPVGVIPVQLNDIFFSVHASAIVLVSIIQCCIYERGGQKVSKTCGVILSLMLLFMLISTILAATRVITWLTCLYFFSYVKLAVTLVKYVPQAVLNCHRRSTMGWSIYQIMCDFTGGVLSILQMFLIAYNSDDWGSVFGSPTKLGLGIFSIAFDFVFFAQHYCIFRDSRARVAETEVSLPVDDGDENALLQTD